MQRLLVIEQTLQPVSPGMSQRGSITLRYEFLPASLIRRPGITGINRRSSHLFIVTPNQRTGCDEGTSDCRRCDPPSRPASPWLTARLAPGYDDDVDQGS